MEELFKIGYLVRYDTYVNEAQVNLMLKPKPTQQTDRLEILPKLKEKLGNCTDMLTYPNVQSVLYQHLRYVNELLLYYVLKLWPGDTGVRQLQ